MSAVIDALSVVLSRLRVQSEIYAELSYCGTWHADPSDRFVSTFHLVRAGECWLHVEDRPALHLKPGSFVLLPRNGRHLISSDSDLGSPLTLGVENPQAGEGSTEVLCGYFDFESHAAGPVLDYLPDVLRLDTSSEEREDTCRLLELMIDEAAANRPGRRVLINQLACAIFTHAVRAHLESGASSGLMAAFTDPRIGRSLNRFHQEPELRWNVRQLAEIAGMSRSIFSDRFRLLTGITPMEYVSDWRMQLAGDLLATSDYSVAQIAERVGYESEAAFRTAFRKRLGYPPGVVRRAERQPISQ